MGIKVEWFGDKVSKDIKDRLSARLSVGLSKIVEETKAELPRQTGNLAESVRYSVTGLDGKWGTDVEYASEVEFGTEDRAPDGTWRRVMDRNKGPLKDILVGKDK